MSVGFIPNLSPPPHPEWFIPLEVFFKLVQFSCYRPIFQTINHEENPEKYPETGITRRGFNPVWLIFNSFFFRKNNSRPLPKANLLNPYNYSLFQTYQKIKLIEIFKPIIDLVIQISITVYVHCVSLKLKICSRILPRTTKLFDCTRKSSTYLKQRKYKLGPYLSQKCKKYLIIF